MLERAELERRVKSIASEVFPAVAIVAVHCSRDTDHEGDPVVWVRIVAADDTAHFDVESHLSLGPRLFDAFGNWGEPGYPVVSLYLESEYRTLRPVAA